MSAVFAESVELSKAITVLAGTATGELLLWQHGRCELVIRANRQQPIFAVHASNAGVFAAGRGGRQGVE